jgi:hypothetical protein
MVLGYSHLTEPQPRLRLRMWSWLLGAGFVALGALTLFAPWRGQ